MNINSTENEKTLKNVASTLAELSTGKEVVVHGFQWQ
jgi:hypothetical protein